MRELRHYVRGVLLLMLTAACGQNTGCSGCDQEGPPFPNKDRVHSAVQVRLTEPGLRFLSENLEPLIQDLLPADALNVCIPGDGGDLVIVQWGYCDQEVCENGERGCQVGIEIGGVQLQAVQPAQVNATVRFNQLRARFDIHASPVVSCAIAIDAPGFAATVPLNLSTPEPTRDLTFALGTPVWRLRDLNIRLEAGDGFLSPLCEIIDGVINFPIIGDVILDVVQGFVDGLLPDLLRGFVEDFTCRTCDEDTPCPGAGGARCVDGRCMLGEVCLPQPLGIEGTLDVGDLLSGFAPGLEASIDYLATPGSYVEVENAGLSLGIIAGAVSERDRCVPRRPQPPTNVEPMRSPTLRGNVDPRGREYEVGLGITDLILQHVFWSVFNAGTLCLSITSDTIDQLSLLGAAIPGLRNLPGGQNAPLAITLAPQEVPVATIGANIVEIGEDGMPVLTEPLVTLTIPDLWLDFHGFIEDRWLRLFSLHLDVSVPLGIAFSPENGLLVSLGDVNLGEVRTANGEIVGGNLAALERLLPTVIGPLLGTATEALSDPIQLPDIMGYRLDLQEGSVTGVDDNTMLAVFANLERDEAADGAGARFAVDTGVEVREVYAPPFAEVIEADGADPFVRLALDAWDGTAEGAEMEWSVKVGDHTWSLFTPAREVVLRHPAFRLPGRHTVQVRARRADDYHSLDPTPVTLEVLIDGDAPALALAQEGARIAIDASDLVTPAADLTLSARRDDGAWIELDGPAVAVGDAREVTVRAVDEAGNVTEASIEVRRNELIGRPPPDVRNGDGGGCGCSFASPGNRALDLWLLLAPAALLGLRRRRKTLLAAFLALFATAGCDDAASKGDGRDRDGGVRDTGPDDECDCAPNEVCVEGACQIVTCKDNPAICNGISCENGPATCNDMNVCECEPFCAGGCGGDEFCCMNTNSCEPLPGPCPGFACDAGYEPMVLAPGEIDADTCMLAGAECGCVEAPPLEVGEVGRFSDLAVVDGTAWVSAYDATYGDLVVGRHTRGGFEWHWVDGVPEGEVVAGPSGPRGGVRIKGDDVGRYTSIVAGAEGRLHVAYWDGTHNALKYALGMPEGDGYRWTTQTLDQSAGRWTSISVDARGVPGIAYRAQPGGSPLAVSETRYLLAKNPSPGAAADWNPPFTLHRLELDPAEAASSSYPDGTGLFTTQARALDGSPVVAWYDRYHGALLWSRFVDAGFTEPEQLAGWGIDQGREMPTGLEGDMGANVDIAVDAEGNFHLCYQDGATDSLRYLAPELGHSEWIDDGVRVDTDGREYAVHVVGDDCNIRIAADGDPVVVYQDATGHDLLMLHRDSQGSWVRSALRGHENNYRGAAGFWASVELVGDEAWITHYVYDFTANPPTQRLELLNQPL